MGGSPYGLFGVRGMTPGAPPPTPSELLHAISAIVDAVDERARECNRKWGMNRLPLIVPLEWMERFRDQKNRWQRTVFESAPVPTPDCLASIRKQGEAMLRAFDKLESLAVADGHLPAPPAQWEFELNDGTPVILVRDRAELAQVDPKGRPVAIWSLEEVADIISKFPELVLGTKQAFPGAEIIRTRTDRVVTDALDDAMMEIPF
jgi:hypothetical protein